MARSRWLLASAAFGGALSVSAALASETTTYSYDALGRLVATTHSGGPNNGVAMATCFDPAGNRTAYTVVASGAATCGTPTPTPTPGPTPTPTPSPTPTPTNQPPVAVADTIGFTCNVGGTINLIANDYDPDGNTPLHLVSIDNNDSSGTVSAYITSTSSVAVNGTTSGTYYLNYEIADSLGATNTGILTVNVADYQYSCGP
jgi:hypothetical protein